MVGVYVSEVSLIIEPTCKYFLPYEYSGNSPDRYSTTFTGTFPDLRFFIDIMGFNLDFFVVQENPVYGLFHLVALYAVLE